MIGPTPLCVFGSEDRVEVDNGTLRDYFAAKAMQGLIARNVPHLSVIARESYRYADAMLKAREAK